MTSEPAEQRPRSSDPLRTVARWVLATFLIGAGISHFTRAEEFLAQVPPQFPAPEVIVAISGVVEIALGASLLVLRRYRATVGWVTAGFFVVIFPGNIAQFLTGTTAFGLDSDLARGMRLLFQPVLVIWALWCTGAWRDWRAARQQATP